MGVRNKTRKIWVKATILDKRPWDSTAIFIFLGHFPVPSQNSASFSKFWCSSPAPPPPPLYKVETRKKFWIHGSNVVCGVRGGV